MVRENMDYLTAVGGFGGLYNHSMVLGPMSAISSIMLLSKFMHFQKDVNRNRKMIHLFVLLCTMGSTLLSASRTAVLGMFIVFAVLFFKNYSASVTRLMKYSFITSMVLLATSPLWVGMFDRVMSKQNANVETGEGSFSSRASKFDARFYEIEKSPLLGTGFASIDINSGDHYQRETGQIEPGSSWLYILSSTGIIGFLCFIAFAIKHYYILYKRIRISPYHSTIAGIVFFFALSMVTEGYVVSGGSYLCYCIWLSFGNSSIALNNKSIV